MTVGRIFTMHGLGVHVVVVRDNEVLLIKREDFEVWALPGGEIDTGERPVQTAVREVFEETGLTVRLTCLVGLYSKPQWTNTNAVFAAEIVGGYLRASTAETRDSGFFDPANLPEPLLWWCRQEIQDALNGIGGSTVWMQDAPWPTGTSGKLSRGEIYQLRDASGLSRAAFYQSIFPQGAETPDVAGHMLK